MPAASDAALELLATAELARSTSFSAPGWSACARRSCSPARAAATLRPCCSMPPGASNRSTPRWRARRISKRSRRRCSPVASGRTGRRARRPRPLGLRRRTQQPPRAIDLLLDGLATRFTEGYVGRPAAAPEGARRVSQDVEAMTDDDMRWLWLACRLAQDLWDDELWHVLATRGVRARSRDRRAHRACRMAPHTALPSTSMPGSFAAAAALTEEADAITQATGMPPLRYASLMLAAWRGDRG